MKLKNNPHFASIILAGMMAIFVSCKQQPSAQAPIGISEKDNLVIVPDHDPIKAKLKESLVDTISYTQQVVTAGTVKAIPTQYAEIAPPFQGRVTRSFLKPGMKTTAETPLFEISSPDFITAQKVFFQEKSQMQQAERVLKRQKDLMAHGVGIQKELEEAQTAFDVEKKEYENALIGIKIFKADPEKLSLGQPLTVYSPIKGEVIENKVVLGQFIKDDAASVATIANLSKVWVVGQVKEKDIQYIHENGACEIEIAAIPGKKLKAKIYRIAPMVDEETRSIAVFIECENEHLLLKPGMYVNVDFLAPPGAVIAIPSKALLQMNGASFVFVIDADGKYERRKVETGASTANLVIIKSGLKKGEKIVSAGGFYLLQAKP